MAWTPLGNVPSDDDLRDFSNVLDAAVGAASNEHLFDGDVADGLSLLEVNKLQ